ncbi:MAG: ATP-binding cassette domain-containing protein [Ruminococcus sp.]|nr:ATP-binding cassette domain-containing protein [Ruminococcus sp.]
MIEIKNLSKTFTTKSGDVEALKNISLTIPDGEIYGIIGMSGAGKSTLVRCINMLERPTEGSVLIDGVNLSELSEAQLRQERQKITMIFQDFNLLMQRNCLKNVCFPLELAGVKKSKAVARATELLEIVGLADKAKNYPAQLSGGQQQRVAIARALATHPKILLCDEATSALDPQTTHSILSLIRDVRDRLGLTVIVITHQMSVVEEICGRVAILNGGEVAEEGPVNEVFSAPKSEAAKRLVYPDSYSETLAPTPSEHFIRVVYNGAEVSKTPLIAQMAMDKNIPASIRSASTRSIGGKAYGNMLLSVTGDEALASEAISYLSEIPDIIAEEVRPNA